MQVINGDEKKVRRKRENSSVFLHTEHHKAKRQSGMVKVLVSFTIRKEVVYKNKGINFSIYPINSFLAFSDKYINSAFCHNMFISFIQKILSILLIITCKKPESFPVESGHPLRCPLSPFPPIPFWS